MKRLLQTIAVVLLSGTCTAQADLPGQPVSVTPTTPIQPMPVQPGVVQPVPVQRRLLEVGVGGGLLVELPAAASTVLAADPKIAKVEPASPTSLFIIGIGPGVTTIIATTQAGQPIANYTVAVAAAPAAPSAAVQGAPRSASVSSIQAAIASLEPGAYGVQVRRAGAALVLTGSVGTPEIAAQIVALAHAYAGTGLTVINNLAVLSSIQVNVQVRVAEVSRTLLRQLGFNWQALGTGSHWQFGLLTGSASSVTLGAQTPLANGDQIGGGYTSPSGRWNATSVINALAQNELITLLAEPNLTVESGHSASFLSGGEYPIPVPSSGSNQISIEYKQYGVSLKVVPTVLSPGRISLQVKPEVSALSTAGAISINGVSVPALTTQKAETTIELGSGQSFAIAGLLDNTVNQTGSGLPGLSSVPILGAMFDSTQVQRASEELVIIVTPYLVNPVANSNMLHAPTDNFVPATSLEEILFGHELAVGTSQGTPLDAGFIME